MIFVYWGLFFAAHCVSLHTLALSYLNCAAGRLRRKFMQRISVNAAYTSTLKINMLPLSEHINVTQRVTEGHREGVDPGRQFS